MTHASLLLLKNWSKLTIYKYFHSCFLMYYANGEVVSPFGGPIEVAMSLLVDQASKHSSPTHSPSTCEVDGSL